MDSLEALEGFINQGGAENGGPNNFNNSNSNVNGGANNYLHANDKNSPGIMISSISNRSLGQNNMNTDGFLQNHNGPSNGTNNMNGYTDQHSNANNFFADTFNMNGVDNSNTQDSSLGLPGGFHSNLGNNNNSISASSGTSTNATNGFGGVPNFKVDDFLLENNMNNHSNSISLNLDEENSVASPNPPESVGGLSSQYFSPRPSGLPSPGVHQRSGSTSNQLGKSYTSQLGSSMASSAYDSLLDSPYGSFQGSVNDSYLKSPTLESTSLSNFGSPASFSSHLNSKKLLSKEGKINRRRELHNAVERRRRDLIKEKIRELGTLVPPMLLFDGPKRKASTKKESRANKSTILSKSVIYIENLQLVMKMQEERRQMLVSRITALSRNGNGSSPESVSQSRIQSPGSELNAISENSLVNTDAENSNTNIGDRDADTFGFTPIHTPYSNGTSPFATNGNTPLGLDKQTSPLQSSGPARKNGGSSTGLIFDGLNSGTTNNTDAKDDGTGYSDAYLKEFLTTTPSGNTPNFTGSSADLAFGGFGG